MIVIEGIEVQAKRIPKKAIYAIWKTLSEKPFPKVVAFQLADDDFNCFMKLIKCKANERIELEEWGRVLATTGTDACVFRADEYREVDYVILIRKNPYHGIDEILEHELAHINRGDL